MKKSYSAVYPCGSNGLCREEELVLAVNRWNMLAMRGERIGADAKSAKSARQIWRPRSPNLRKNGFSLAIP